MANIDIYREKLSKIGITVELNKIISEFEWKLYSQSNDQYVVIKTKILQNLKDKTFSYVNSHYYKSENALNPYKSGGFNNEDDAIHHAIGELFLNIDEQVSLDAWVKNKYF